MADQNRSEELPVIRAYYELILWLMPKIGKFSREHRFTLGQRMELLLYEILEKLIRARYTRDRRSILESVNNCATCSPRLLFLCRGRLVHGQIMIMTRWGW